MIPAEFITMLIAATPIAEVRASIPFAVHILKLPPLSAYLFSVLGNIIPSLSIIVIGAATSWLSHRSYFLNRFFTWLFERTRKKHHHRISNMHELGLLIFVAIPLPLTGVWTASLIAFLFGIPFLRAFPYIVGGSAIASLLTLLASLGLTSLF